MKRLFTTTQGRFWFVVLTTIPATILGGILVPLFTSISWGQAWGTIGVFVIGYAILSLSVFSLWDWIHAASGPKKTDLNATVEQVGRSTTELTVPWPMMAPFGADLGPEAVQEVWDAFVVPDQERGGAQSVEMRLLMAILRSMYAGMNPIEPGWKKS